MPLPISDDDSFEEYEQFNDDDDDDDDELDLGYLDSSNDSISVQVLTDEEISVLQDSSAGVSSNRGPTRANARSRTSEKTRTTFICLNQEAFKTQLQKEQQKSVENAPNTGPTRAKRSNTSRTTTFICLNEDSFKENLLKEQQKVNTLNQKPKPQTTGAPPVPNTVGPPPGAGNTIRPPVPARRPSRPIKKEESSPNVHNTNPRGVPNQGKFGVAPPARRLSQSTPVAAKRKMPPAYKELITTEKDYIANLEIIVNVFLKEIRTNQILSSYETVSLFSNIEDILPVNKNLLKDLNNLEVESTKSVGEVFQAHAKNFNVYGNYCTNQPNIHELVQEYKRENKEFAEFLKKCFKLPQCRKQDIESFLMMPLQRLCKYPLLLRELVSFETYSMNKDEPTSSDFGICVWGNNSENIIPVDSAQHWIGISCGGLHYAALTLGNSVYVWGQGKEGQLGLGESVTSRDIPTLVPLYSKNNQPLKALSVTCGPIQTAIITDKQELYIWGSLPSGRSFVPRKQLFGGIDRIVLQVTLGVSSFFAILQVDNDPSDTEVWVWGKSSKGQLGLGDIHKVDKPTKIMELNGKNIVQISSGESHVCCLSEHGAVFIWGDNTNNVLGLGSHSDSSKPQLVMSLLGKEIIELRCGFNYTLARTSDGNIYSWGYGRHGVLGIGTSIDVGSLSTISGLSNKNIKSIVSGGMHSFAITIDGKAYSWGEGRGYKTCQGTQDDILSPTLVKNLSSYVIKEVACGSNSSVAYFEKYSETQSSIVNLGEGLEEFRSIVVDINDQVRKVENITNLLKIQDRIENGERLNLVKQSRICIKEGPMNVNNKNRYAFLFDDLLLFCRLPSKKDPEKLYKAFKRCKIEDCAIIDLPDTDNGKNCIEIQVNSKPYNIKLRKRDRKISWINEFKNLNIPLLDIKSSLLKSNNQGKRTITRSNTLKDLKQIEQKALDSLLKKLEKELKEESQARLIAEQHNEAMINLVQEQMKQDSANLMDENSINDLKERLESLSTMVDKLTSNNITLTNEAKEKREELISLRKSAGKTIDDIIKDGEDSDTESEED